MINNRVLLLLGLTLLCLMGCDTFHGPALRNVSKEPMKVTIYFADGGSTTTELNPGISFLQLNRSRELQKIIVIQNDKQAEYGDDVIRSLLVHGPLPSDAIFLIGGKNLEVESLKANPPANP